MANPWIVHLFLPKKCIQTVVLDAAFTPTSGEPYKFFNDPGHQFFDSREFHLPSIHPIDDVDY